MKLLLDAGNSRLKWALVGAGDERRTGAVSADPAGLSDLAARTERQGVPETVAIVSVRDAGFLEDVTRWCALRNWPAPVPVQVCRGIHGIWPAYAQPESLGADRYAAMVAARRLFPGPLVVVDCGTAVTLDVLDEHGRHLGGLIMPGLSLMRHALSAGTAALSGVASDRILLLADNTADAVTGGTALGLVSAVDGLCQRISREYGGGHRHILTGGDGPLVKARGGLDYEWCPWLVLQGVDFIMEGGPCERWH